MGTLAADFMLTTSLWCHLRLKAANKEQCAVICFRGPRDSTEMLFTVKCMHIGPSTHLFLPYEKFAGCQKFASVMEMTVMAVCCMYTECLCIAERCHSSSMLLYNSCLMNTR